jgi:hypothetical protein
MLQMDEMVAQTPLKDLAQVELVLERIPTKSLYKIQVSVASGGAVACMNRCNRLAAYEEWKGSVRIGSQSGQARNQGRKETHPERLEQGLITTYNRITINTQAVEQSTVENIDLIVHTIDQYQQEINELKKNSTPQLPRR